MERLQIRGMIKQTGLTAALLAAALTGGALAQVTMSSIVGGGAQISVRLARENTPSGYSSTGFVDVPGSALAVSVPAGTTNLIVSRFSAESQVTSEIEGVGFATVRIVAVNAATGGMLELLPSPSHNFAFDSNDAGREGAASWESHAMERSVRLGPGRWIIKAQAKVNDAGVLFELDMWSHSVEVSK